MERDGALSLERMRQLSAQNPEEREALRRRLIGDDLRRVLSTQEGLRVFGKILACCGLRERSLAVREHAVLAYQLGMRTSGDMIADAIREVDPRLVAECEIANAEFERMFEDLVDSGKEE